MSKSNPFKVLMTEGSSNADHSVPVRMVTESGRYRLGDAVRPHIKHDNGHLDKYVTREATAQDRAALAMWVAGLEGDEALRPHLSDAHAAYRHFLYGKGRDRMVDYEKYIKTDPAGERLMALLIEDFMVHAEAIGENRKEFSLTSTAFGVGPGKFAPHPVTENWTKTLGRHVFWVSASLIADVSGEDIRIRADITIHAEDRYNFNPGAKDIATGIPDSANGRFELCGLAHQYMNYGRVTRSASWMKGKPVTLKFEDRGTGVGHATSLPTEGSR